MKSLTGPYACIDTFPFTRKKFMRLRAHTRHRHVVNWLSSVYQKLITNRMGEQSLMLIYDHYSMMLNWLNIQCPPIPETGDRRSWIEFVSNAAYFHRVRAGIVPRDHHLLETVTFQDRCAPPASGMHPASGCHIALDGLRSLFNVGSIIRTCDAAGFLSVILGNTPGDEHPAVRKTAMGAHQWVTQTRTADLAATLTDLKNQEFQVIGIETMRNSRSFAEYDWPAKAVLVFGNEEYGISASVLGVCDAFVHIPVFGRKNSINVASAVSVVAFHVACQLTRHS